jgi:hypothetical protein
MTYKIASIQSTIQTLTLPKLLYLIMHIKVYLSTMYSDTTHLSLLLE